MPDAESGQVLYDHALTWGLQYLSAAGDRREKRDFIAIGHRRRES